MRRPYAQNCKGCTTYRPNDVTGAVLEVKPVETEKQVAASTPRNSDVVYLAPPLDRPEELPGRTYKIKWPGSDHAIYITVNDVMQEGRRRPFEIFINSKNMEHYAWTVALTRMISAVFRRGGGRLVRRRGVEGGVRSSRRTVDGRSLRAVAAGCDRAA